MPGEHPHDRPPPALLSRIEAATGPDRELDAIIARDLAGVDIGGFVRNTPENGGRYIGVINNVVIDRYTASIDAALALVEKVLPGAEYSITTLYGIARAELPLNYGNSPTSSGHRADENMPLAILAALLRSILHQEGGG